MPRHQSRNDCELHINSFKNKNELRNTGTYTKYRSKFYEEIDKQNRSEKRSTNKTMGSPHVTKVDPKQFLKKGGGFKPAVPHVTHIRRKLKLPKVPPRFPSVSINTAQLIEIDNKNDVETPKTISDPFIDIEEDSMSRSEFSDSNKSISRLGESTSLVESKPIYVLKTSFGKVPQYIIEPQGNSSNNQEQSKEVENTKTRKCNLIQEMERNAMLLHLKEHWMETYREFQKMPLRSGNDELSKKRLELDYYLDALEGDIRILEQHPIIYIKEE